MVYGDEFWISYSLVEELEEFFCLKVCARQAFKDHFAVASSGSLELGSVGVKVFFDLVVMESEPFELSSVWVEFSLTS